MPTVNEFITNYKQFAGEERQRKRALLEGYLKAEARSEVANEFYDNIEYGDTPEQRQELADTVRDHLFDAGSRIVSENAINPRAIPEAKDIIARGYAGISSRSAKRIANAMGRNLDYRVFMQNAEQRFNPIVGQDLLGDLPDYFQNFATNTFIQEADALGANLAARVREDRLNQENMFEVAAQLARVGAVSDDFLRGKGLYRDQQPQGGN